MKNVLLMFYFAMPIYIFGQEFSTKFIFQDSTGRSDSIIVGYSPNATDSLDTSLGEINLQDSQIDINFCVYTSNIASFGGQFVEPKFKSKKQIISTNKNSFVNIGIICKNFPLTIKWDKSAFKDTSRSKSYIISFPAKCCFDVGDPPHWLSQFDSVNYKIDDGVYIDNTYYFAKKGFYIDSISSKPIDVWELFLRFVNNGSDLDVINNNTHLAEIYPNPCSNVLNIRFYDEKERFLKLYDLSGRLYYSIETKNIALNINISDFPDDIYIIRVNSNNDIITQKIIKINKK